MSFFTVSSMGIPVIKPTLELIRVILGGGARAVGAKAGKV
jgi:hypothetical protein